MVAGSFSRENASTVAIDKVWKAGVLDAHNLLPKLLPEFILKVELLEGDGGVGTVKKFIFTEAVKEFPFVVDKTVVLDHQNHLVKQIIVDGGLIGLRLKSYSFEIKFDVGSKGETLEKTIVEYDTLDDTPLSHEEQDQIMEGLLLMTKAVEGYINENPTAYA